MACCRQSYFNSFRGECSRQCDLSVQMKTLTLTISRHIELLWSFYPINGTVCCHHSIYIRRDPKILYGGLKRRDRLEPVTYVIELLNGESLEDARKTSIKQTQCHLDRGRTKIQKCSWRKALDDALGGNSPQLRAEVKQNRQKWLDTNNDKVAEAAARRGKIHYQLDHDQTCISQQHSPPW